MPLLEFGKSELFHKEVSETTEKRLKKLYKSVYVDVSKDLAKLDKDILNNKPLQYRKTFLKDLQQQLKYSYDNVSGHSMNIIKDGLFQVSNKVVDNNNKILKELNINIKGAFAYVPKDVVTSILDGKLYKSKWTLSKRLWNIDNATNQDIRRIIAKGIAQGTPTYDIAKALEKYVNPNATKEYKWSRLYPGTNKVVDYNAQRVARTTITHAYQQSVKEVTEQNPLADGILWLATGSERMCDICSQRNGKVFKPSELPLDHPNGQCTMATYFSKSTDQIVKQLSDESSSEKEAIQVKINALKNNAQVKDSGYNELVFNEKQQKYLSSHYSPSYMPKNADDFIELITYNDAQSILKEMGTDWNDPYAHEKMVEYYDKYLAPDKMISGKKAIKNTEKKVVKPAKSISNKIEDDNWLDKIQSQTESQMLDLEKASFKKMTKAQLGGIKAYTGSAYKQINGYLRLLAGGASEEQAISGSGIFKRQLKFLQDAYEGLKKARTEQDLVVRRDTDLGDLAGLMGGNFNENKKMLYDLKNKKSPEEFVKELNDRFQGMQGKYAGFTSTSSLYNKGFVGDVEIIFKLPKGSQASSVMSISRYGTSEGETLLNAGTKVRIERIEKSDSHKDSNIRIIIQVLK